MLRRFAPACDESHGGLPPTNEAELFAVAVETFFEQRDRLEKADPTLFGLLRDYFQQDPRRPS